MLACAIYSTLTLIIPLRLTFNALKQQKGEQSCRLWAHYWGYYVFIAFLSHSFPFLNYQPFKFVLLLLQLWLYYHEYQGALLVSQTIRKKLIEFGLAEHINHLGKNLSPIGVFEQDPAAVSSPENISKKIE